MSKNLLIAIIAVPVFILSLLLGYILTSKSPAPNPAVATPAPPPPPAPAPQSNILVPDLATPAAPAGHPAEFNDDRTLSLSRTLADLSSPTWSDLANGCQMDRDQNELRIHGTQNKPNWVDNGISSSLIIPDGSFTISADVKLVKPPAGTAPRNAYIRVLAADRSAIGVFEDDRAICSVQDWKNPQTHGFTSFRDIDPTTFHRLTLNWDDPAQTASATIDGKKIGTIQTTLGTRRRLTLFANSNAQGTEFDIYFKNLTIQLPPTPAAGI